MSEEMVPGTTVGGRYLLVNEIGEGGMGKVFHATDQRLGRDVALKVQFSSVRDNEEAKSRFLREARVGAQLSHPNLVRTYDFGVISDCRYLVMELLAGQDLSDRLAEDRPLTISTAIEYTQQVAAGMAMAHSQGLIHRDLKPENIFLSGDPVTCKVVDFGLAMALDASSSMGRITIDGAIAGTPWYLAPETLRGEPTEEPADVYALGCVLFQMLAGRPPFGLECRGVGEIVAEHLYKPIPRVTDFRKDSPPLISELVRRCLAKDSSARPTMQQLHDRLVAAKSAPNAPPRGSRGRPRPSQPSAALPVEPQHVATELPRVAVVGGNSGVLEVALGSSGFRVIFAEDLRSGDALVCLGMSLEELQGRMDEGVIVVADASPGDTARVAELLRLGVQEVLAAPAQDEDIIKKLRRANRIQARKRKSQK